MIATVVVDDGDLAAMGGVRCAGEVPEGLTACGGDVPGQRGLAPPLNANCFVARNCWCSELNEQAWVMPPLPLPLRELRYDRAP